jgi:uncharacterized membrane protein
MKLRVKLSFAQDVLEFLAEKEQELKHRYEGRTMSMEKAEALSTYHTDEVNSALNHLFNINSGIAWVVIHPKLGVYISVLL